MYQILAVYLIFLSLIFSLGASNVKVIGTSVYDDKDINDIKRQGELLIVATENLRNLMESIKDRLDQADVLKEIKEMREIQSANEDKGLDAAIKNLALRMDTNDERLGNISKDLIEVKEHLFTMERTSRIESTDERLDRITDMLKEGLGNMQGIEENGNISVYPTSCLELSEGVHVIQINKFGPRPFRVLCDDTTQGGGWTTIQRRLDGTVDFNRNWIDYKRGFGHLAGEFFIGLDKLHAMTNACENELLIVMRDKQNEEKFAKYDAFAIGGESEGYALNVLGQYTGGAGDSLRFHKTLKFATKDKGSGCAADYQSPWWYKDPPVDCGRALLNGQYGVDRMGEGIIWMAFHGHSYSLPYVRIMIRPKKRSFLNLANNS